MAQMNWADLMSQAEEGPQPIPEGPYDVVVDTAQYKPTNNGKPMIVAVLKVVNGPYVGKKVWNNFVLSEDNPAALGFFFEHMAAFGIDQSTIAQLPPPAQGGVEQIAAMLPGKYATAYVGHKLYNGSPRNEVKSIKPYSGGAVAQPGIPQAPAAPTPTPQVAAPGAVPAAPAPPQAAAPPAAPVPPVPQPPAPVAPAPPQPPAVPEAAPQQQPVAQTPDQVPQPPVPPAPPGVDEAPF